MSNLYEAVNNVTLTENGATTFKSSLDSCLDLFSMGGAYRSRTEEEMTSLVENAWNEDPLLTVKILCFLRDCRGGVGEKKFPNFAFHYLATKHGDEVSSEAILSTLVKLGCWKDIISTFDVSQYSDYVRKVVDSTSESSEPNLMFKWLPSIGGSRNGEAEKLAKSLGLTPRQYRKLLSRERGKIGLVESKMCSKSWSDIDYSKLPSKAGLVYREAFFRNDSSRYISYNKKVMNGEAKMNANLVYPYEVVRSIVPKYFDGYEVSLNDNETINLDNFWRNLKDYNCEGDSLVVADVSGSMTCDNYTPISVSVSLALYFAEKNKGKFKDEFITFSESPSFHKVKGNNIVEKVCNALGADWGMSTNLQSVFDLILDTAKRNKMKESDMPQNLYIISDMEFNTATHGGSSVTNFEEIDRKYREAGYRRPNLIFWNVASRNDNVPITKEESGTALVSGCSPIIFEMAIGGDLNPINFMLKAVEKYEDISYTIIVKEK